MPTYFDNIRAGYVKVLPWLDIHNDSYGVGFNGPYAHICRILEDKLNISFTYIPSIDGSYGTFTMDNNWTGLLGMIHRKEIDMVICPIAMTYGRLAVLKYAAPVYGTHLTILAAQPQEYHVSVFGYLAVFNLEVWIAVLATIVILVIFATFLDFMMKFSPPSLCHLFLNNLSSYVGGLLLEASPRNVSHHPGRILLAFWWLTVLVLTYAFIGHFKSSIMLIDNSGRINSIDDLLQRTDIVPQIWKSSAYEDFMRTSPNPHIVALMAQVIKKDGVISFSELFSKENVQKLQMGKVVIVSEELTSKATVGIYCSSELKGLYIADEKFFPHYATMAMRKDIPDLLQNKISTIIFRLTESGLMTKWLENMFKNWTCCSVLAERSEKRLELKEMFPFFIIIPMCSGISALVLLIEICYYRINQKSALKYN